MVYLTVFGKSMLPTLFPGDLVCVRRVDPKTLAVDDIVMFCREQQLVIHRIVEIREWDGKRFFSTRGDSMPQSDPEVDESNILGKVVSEKVSSPSMRRTRWNRWVGSALSHDPMASLASRLLDERQSRKRRAGAAVTGTPAVPISKSSAQ